MGDPGSSSHDDGEGWISGAGDVCGWGFWDGAGGVRFYHTIQNGTQCKTCELFVSGIFHIIFLD